MNWSTRASKGSMPSLGAQRSARRSSTDLQALAGRGSERGGDPLARLDGGLLVGADDVVAGVQQLAFPAALVEVEDRAGPVGEARVAREDPGAVLPGLDRVLRQPAPDGHSADLLDDPACNRLARQLRRRPARQRHTLLGGQRAGHRDHLSAYLKGGKIGGRPRRGRSSRPARRCSKKRLRHCETTSRRQFSRAAIWSLRSPSAASNTIWARVTCQYGNV